MYLQGDLAHMNIELTLPLAKLGLGVVEQFHQLHQLTIYNYTLTPKFFGLLDYWTPKVTLD